MGSPSCAVPREQKCRKWVPKRSPPESAHRFRLVRRPATFLRGRELHRPSETGSLQSSMHGWIAARRLCFAIETPPVSELAGGTDLQLEIVVRAEDETCAGAEDLSTEVDAAPVGGADMRERDGGKEWVQVEDGQEELEWKEGEERAEGEDERSEGGEDACCGESSDSVGHLYRMQRGGDVDDEATMMEMETHVGIGLSPDSDAFDVHPLEAAVHLRDVCEEVAMAVGRTKTTH